ncbi:MAG: GAF domain-containing protein [Leptolyngbyaceae cyanobacterium RU_5_1]|nr:GAF domain-containing protein [Leptolyngbyaceae cyanobacterium RU_5_1]
MSVCRLNPLQLHECQLVIDGEVRDEEARVIAVSTDEALIIVRDITNRKQAEQALRQSEATNRAMISAIPDLLIRMSRDGTFLDIVENRTVKLLKPKHTQIGRNICDVMPFEIAQQRIGYIQQAFQSGKPQLYEQQIEIEGVVYDEEVRIAVINDDEVLVMIRDISQEQTALRERKRAEEALRQQIEREQAINRVIQTIRNSLDLTTVFSTAAREVINLLPVNRVSIVKYLPDQRCWRSVAGYCSDSALPTRLNEDIPDQGNSLASQLKQLNIVRVDDTNTLMDEINRSPAQEFPGAWLLVRLDVDGSIWGSLTLMKIPQPSPWQDSEIELASAIADQLAIAIQQSELYQQVQQLNTQLEYQVQERTVELQQALNFEALLKRITDKVRDSLDENQILQTAVDELGKGLQVECCNAALYNMKLVTLTVKHEYTIFQPFALGKETLLSDCPTLEIFDQLFQEQYSQFCFTSETDAFIQPAGETYAVLACPLFDDQGVLGDLWLYKKKRNHFNDLEVRLVQQVANQCAIALRQSRLYQAEQAQVKELERLNRLKDDFLSTVSHELRTPMSNIKMATQMLEVSLKQMGLLEIKENRVTRYLQILREECYRETRLINDLLDLSRLDFGAEPLTLNDLSLQDWIPKIAEAFSDRIRNHQQQLSIEIPPDLPPLTTDFNCLELILTELLHNACKYTPAGEWIVVAAMGVLKDKEMKKCRDEEQSPSTLSNPSSRYPFISSLQISVRNSGVEIPPQELNRVFDKFYRVPNNDPWKHGGTGLGLTLIKKRVERIQGAIEVISGEGWTTFTIQLPWSIET